MSDLSLSDFIAALPVGRDNAIRREELAELLDIDVRTLRAMAHEAVEAGHPVLADNRGIYLPSCAEDGDETIRRLESSARTQLRRAALTRNLIWRAFHPHQERLL